MNESRDADALAASPEAVTPRSAVHGNGNLGSPAFSTTSSSRFRTPLHAGSHAGNAVSSGVHASAASLHSISLQQMLASSLHASRIEQVDVAIVGAGLCGLACAAAIHRVRPDCVVKVYERRPNPMQAAEDAADNADSHTADNGEADDDVWPIGGGVRLEANGLKALTAVSRKLAAGVLSEGVYAQRVLLHDTETGTVITHLQEQPHLSSASPRQPALVVGWSELEDLLLSQLPADTVQWGAISTSYTDMASQGGVVLEVLTPKPTPDDRQHLTANPVDGDSRVVSPFSAVAAVTGGSNWGSSHQQSRPTTPAVGAAAAAAGVQGGSGKGVELERVLVEARLLIAADGPMSLIRQQLAGDGPPQFDGTVRWTGRLPGDLLSTIPVAHEAWWLGPGVTFNSHPLRCGDVVWEAQVSSSTLATAGLKWDEASHSLVPITPSQDPSGPGPDSLAQPGAGPDSQAQPGGVATADQGPQDALQSPRAAGESPTAAAWSSGSPGGGGKATAEAAVAAAPAGEWESNDSVEVVGAAQGAQQEKAASAVGNDAAASGSTHKAEPAGRMPTQALLQKLFARFPAPVLDMISATPPRCVLEASVHTRPARLLPASLGRGAVAVLGQAASPLRPTGQECSQALEDAAELGASIMACGISREALRRLEIKRRPRWKHAMQVSHALGNVSNLGGASLHQGLLDYTAQLHNISFVPLRTIPQHRKNRTKQLLKLAAYTLLASGALAGLGGVAERFRKTKEDQGSKIEGPVGQILAGVEEVGEAAGEVLSNVTNAAVQVPGQLAKAINVGGKTAGKGLAAVGDLAGDAASGDSGDGGKVVYGEVPGSNGGVRGTAGKVRDALVGRAMGIGGVVSRPFVRLAKHRVVHEVAKDLGAF